MVLKQFVDMAREKGAVPVFVTAPARTVYDANGNIKRRSRASWRQ